ncbi:MAG: hypothetical protein J7K82_00620 [Thermoproteales archaeon]|nr:hypothetical protein [Thermoproteales archaeon]
MNKENQSYKKQILVLLFLSPGIAELLSGSSPPLEFFQPLTLLLLIAFYGTGALLIREAWVRWRKSPYSLLLLGAAYGILEEGVLVKSFFSTTWPDLGILAWYGRWLGVNWIWAVMLTIYHAVFSIAIPIILAELAFPNTRNEQWLGSKGIKIVFIVFIGVSTLFFISFRYEVPIVYLLSALFVAVLLIAAAKKLAGKYPLGVEEPPGLVKLAVIGSSWSTFLLIGPHLFGHLGISPTVCVLFLLASFIILLKWVLRHSWHSKLKIFDVITSPLWTLIVLAFIAEIDIERPDNTAGMSLVGLISVLFLIIARKKLKGESRQEETYLSIMISWTVI